ncbi:MAG TPA: lysylphosphatidylglycerol synthase transmembrane domain-containing protein [Actinomycetota bacterium]|nr:lysylphosphatidylglycerol synthase transmembrane domain-containing protein [Actinomycetota bacterium]
MDVEHPATTGPRSGFRTVRIFSSAASAPRARRPTDIILLALSITGVLLLAFPAPGPTKLDTAITDFVQSLPGLIGWFWEICYDLLLGWSLVLLGLAIFTRGRRRLFFEELLAAALALGFAVVAGRASGTDWTLSLKSIGSSGPPPVYLAVRLAMSLAVVVTASPHMTRPLRHVGRWVIGFGAVAGIALGTTLPIGMLAGFLIGTGSAAIVHLLFGSPGGRLTLQQVADALEDLGVAATGLQHAPLQPGGVALVTATTPDGVPLVVKIYGRDAWDGQLLASTWTALLRRGQTPHMSAGRLQQVEHEAFVTLFAQRGGVPVLPIVAAGEAEENDALLVAERTGRPLADAGPVADDYLRAAWSAVGALHDLDIAHGQLDGYRVVVRDDGSPAIADFAEATVPSSRADRMVDRVQLLVTTALSAGEERAVSAAVDALGTDGLGEVLPYLQPAVLDRATRHAVRDQDWSLDHLRKLASEAVGTEPPALEKLRRVSWGSIALVVLLGIVAYSVIAAIANIGVQTLIDDLKKADPWWLLGALLMSPTIQVAQAFGTIGASIRPVRFVPVLMLQYSIQFIALAVPSSAARVALEVRFFERNGVDPGGAVSIGAIDSVCGFVVQIALILVITLTGLAHLSLSSSSSSSSTTSGSSSGGIGLIGLTIALLLVGLLIGLVVPRFRHAMRDAIPRLRASLRAQLAASASALRVLRSPSKLLLIFAGNLASQTLQAIILGVCLGSFGYHTPLAGLILVNTFVSLFAGFMPVPGGMGVAEAGYTAGLVALGIPNSIAMSTAIAYRLVTFYLPPLWGSLAMRWLRRNAYI